MGAMGAGLVAGPGAVVSYGGGVGGLASAGKVATTVLHVGGLGWASEQAVVEQVLGRWPGVALVEANPVAQTATVTFDTGQTSVAELRRWVQECGFHCAGQSVPTHVCDPMAEPGPPGGQTAVAAGPDTAALVQPRVPPALREHPTNGGEGSAMAGAGSSHAGHAMEAEQAGLSPHEMMSHGGAAG